MPPTVPRQEIERRIGAFQTALQADGLDAALIVESSDLYYLTGTNQDAHLVVPAAGEPVYLVRRDLGRARDESPLQRVEPLTSLRDLGPAILEVAGEHKFVLVQPVDEAHPADLVKSLATAASA